MSKSKINLQPAPYQRFTVEMAKTVYTVQIWWSVALNLHTVNIIDPEGNYLVACKGLTPNVDLLATAQRRIGKLYLEGAVPTLLNLGIDNRLIYETAI